MPLDLDFLEFTCAQELIATLLGVSRRTVLRHMAESDLSVKALYNPMRDEELDLCVREIISRQSNSGYQMMKAHLRT